MDLQNNLTSPSSAGVAFVTGATGLLGNNLVRQLMEQGWHVRILVRSRDKARQQFGQAVQDIVVGDMLHVEDFAPALAGVDVVFHTAAYFRDSYGGGQHGPALHATNVLGTRALLQCAWRAGVRRFVQTSSIAVLRGKRGELVDESMLRDEGDADDYYRSKILADREVYDFLARHPEMWAALVLPGWMHGPGDLGPTAAGQVVLDVAHGKLPGVPPGSVSIVDARDVARAMIAANLQGRRGERYLAAGRHLTMAELLPLVARATGGSVPQRRVPLALLYLVAAVSELRARLSGQTALLSWAMVRNMTTENERSRFDASKSERELGLRFTPLAQTLQDEVAWFRQQGLLAAA